MVKHFLQDQIAYFGLGHVGTVKTIQTICAVNTLLFLELAHLGVAQVESLLTWIERCHKVVNSFKVVASCMVVEIISSVCQQWVVELL